MQTVYNILDNSRQPKILLTYKVKRLSDVRISNFHNVTPLSSLAGLPN